MNPVVRYLLNLALGLDRLGNAICGGSSGETMSSHMGRIKEAHGGSIPWTRPFAKIVDAGLNVLQKDHSEHAIERDEFNQIREESVIDATTGLPKCGMICEFISTAKCKTCVFNGGDK
jgi:hypothetical protein